MLLIVIPILLSLTLFIASSLHPTQNHGQGAKKTREKFQEFLKNLEAGKWLKRKGKQLVTLSQRLVPSRGGVTNYSQQFPVMEVIYHQSCYEADGSCWELGDTWQGKKVQFIANYRTTQDGDEYIVLSDPYVV